MLDFADPKFLRNPSPDLNAPRVRTLILPDTDTGSGGDLSGFSVKTVRRPAGTKLSALLNAFDEVGGITVPTVMSRGNTFSRPMNFSSANIDVPNPRNFAASLFSVTEPASRDPNGQFSVAVHIQMITKGSGIPEGPETADIGLGISALMAGWGGQAVPDAKGERDNLYLLSRAADCGNDHGSILINNFAINRAATAAGGDPSNNRVSGRAIGVEGVLGWQTPAPNVAIQQRLSFQLANANAREGAMVGLLLMKEAGAGFGDGLIINSGYGGTWNRNIVIANNNITQLVHRTGDGMLQQYEETGNHYFGTQVSGTGQLTSYDGNFIHVLNSTGDLKLSGFMTSKGYLSRAGTGATAAGTQSWNIDIVNNRPRLWIDNTLLGYINIVQ